MSDINKVTIRGRAAEARNGKTCQTPRWSRSESPHPTTTPTATGARSSGRTGTWSRAGANGRSGARIRKGMLCRSRARLRTRAGTTRGGEKRYVTEIIASKITCDVQAESRRSSGTDVPDRSEDETV